MKLEELKQDIKDCKLEIQKMYRYRSQLISIQNEKINELEDFIKHIQDLINQGAYET